MYLSWWPELWTWRSKEGQTIWGTLNWSATTTWNDCCAHNCSFLKCKQETLKENNHAPSICPGWIISLVVWCIFYCLAYILCEGWWRAPTAKVPGSCWGCAVWHIWSPWRIKTSLPLWLEWSYCVTPLTGAPFIKGSLPCLVPWADPTSRDRSSWGAKNFNGSTSKTRIMTTAVSTWKERAAMVCWPALYTTGISFCWPVEQNNRFCWIVWWKSKRKRGELEQYWS